MKFVYDLLGEGGKLSMMRCMALIVCTDACYIASTKGPEYTTLVLGMISAALAAKFIQKAIENKKDDK